MSRTYRSSLHRVRCYRKHRHVGALQRSKDEYGIRKGARPPAKRNHAHCASIKEDWILKQTFGLVTRPSINHL